MCEHGVQLYGVKPTLSAMQMGWEKKDIVFATHDGVDLMLDIAYSNQTSNPHPALMFISENGWGYFRKGFDRH